MKVATYNLQNGITVTVEATLYDRNAHQSFDPDVFIVDFEDLFTFSLPSIKEVKQRCSEVVKSWLSRQ